MTQDEVLRDLLDRLDEVGVRYMIVGSTASNLWGMPRATQDADIVVELDRRKLDALILMQLLSPDYDLPEGIARAAVERHGVFNVIHSDSAFKIDLVVRKSDARSHAEFERRHRAEWVGRPAWFASPYDVIVAKLRWFREGGGDSQLRDCAGIIEVQAAALDRAKLQQLAREAQVADLLESLLEDTARR